MTRRIIVLAVAISAIGCTVGPTYHRPAIAGVPAFKEAPPAGWKEAQPNEGIPRGRWWEMYNDPQLNELESKVELSNQNVIAAMARYRQAHDQVRIARAALFPTVTATPSILFTRGSSTSLAWRVITANTSSTSSNGAGSSINYTMPVDLSYQADIWGNIRRSVAANADPRRRRRQISRTPSSPINRSSPRSTSSSTALTRTPICCDAR